MSRALCLLGLLAIAAAVPATASAKGFSSGVASAEVTSKSALLWTRADKTGKLTLTVARDKKLHRDAKKFKLNAGKGTDNTVQREVGGLKPGTQYYFRFSRKGASSDRGTFRHRAQDELHQAGPLRLDGRLGPGPGPGHEEAALRALRRLRADGERGQRVQRQPRRHDLFRHRLAVLPPGPACADRLPEAREVPDDADRRQPAQRLRAAGAMYNHWDDHEFLNDFAIGQTRYPTSSGTQEGEPRVIGVDGRKLYRDGAKAFREYMPVTYSKSRGIYRSFRWGKNLEVFFLDERSFRSAEGVRRRRICDNPAGSGSRDLAPTPRSAPARCSPPSSRRSTIPPPPALPRRDQRPEPHYLGTHSSTASRRRSRARRRRSRW